MSKSNRKQSKREPHKVRELAMLGMILAGKGEGAYTRMRDRRERRPMDARRLREEME